MTQEQQPQTDYIPGIVDADIQTLINMNPLAASQLRGIMAERQRDELQEKLDDMKLDKDRAELNGTGKVQELVREK